MADNKVPLSAITLSGLLLSKGISFCLYRFPGEKDFQLAVEKSILMASNRKEASGETRDFIIAPFTKNDTSSTVVLQKLNPEEEIISLGNYIENLPDTPVSWQPLPEAITKNIYLKRFGQYLDDIRSGLLSKAILSRVILVDKPKDFSVFHFFTLLSTTYPDTFASLFYIPGMGIWTGASPELLLKKEKKTYRTMALASTQPTKEEGDYTWRKKEEEEHRLVQEHIEEVFLKNKCSLHSKEGPYTIEAGKVAHLKTDYEYGEAEENVLNTIVEQLHPTPAIGGLPVQEALECISNYEGYARNYYTGYFGETNQRDFSRLYINLRCMQIGSEQIAIYVGGGISADSDPEEEWAETKQKSLTLLEIIEETIRHHAQ